MPSIFGLQRSQLGLRLVQGAVGVVLTAVPGVGQSQLWIDQFGRELGDAARAAVSDGTGGVFVCGYVNGDPYGWYGIRDDFLLTRYDASGERLWTELLSSPGMEQALGMAPDGAGGVFVAGQLVGPFGGPASGFNDSWLMRFDGSGNRLWFHNLGAWARVVSAAPDGFGGVYLVGNTLGLVDAWVGRFDGAGNKLWSVTTIGDWYDFQSATPDGAGGVYVCGLKDPGLDIQGGLARYDGSGTELWSVEIGSPNAWDEADVVLSDGTGGVFVAGIGFGSTAWVARYDGAGTQQWMHVGGLASKARPSAIATDGVGGFYLSLGFGVGGQLLKRYDSAGNLLWSHKIASQGDNYLLGPIMPWALAWDGGSGVFVGGSTEQDLGGPNAGGTDIWLARYDGSCNPGTTYCVASSTSIAGCAASISATGSPTLSNPTAWTVSSGPVPGANLGLLLFGSSGKDNTPYGTLGGKLCVAAPTFRTAPKSSGGDQSQCNGSYAFALADLIAAAPIVTSGATINAQVWARDPANADGFLLSDGLEVTICP